MLTILRVNFRVRINRNKGKAVHSERLIIDIYYRAPRVDIHGYDYHMNSQVGIALH